MDDQELNIYDDINNFYGDDPGWERYLRYSYVDEFLRLQTFGGAKEEELAKLWRNIEMLVIYAGNADILLGDMSHEDLIDGIAWCGRNIAEFRVTYESVDSFLDSTDKLLKYLKDKHAITDDTAAELCRQKLIPVKGYVRLIEKDGTFAPGYESYSFNATTDLPCKVFSGAYSQLNNLENRIRCYYNRKVYDTDRKRAHYLFFEIMPESRCLTENNNDAIDQLFWDYFLFDYHLIGSGKKILRQYYEYYCKNDPQDEAGYKDLLETMMTSRLYLFKVAERMNEVGQHICVDFLSNNKIELSLPYPVEPCDELLYMAHVFADGTVITNYMRCMRITKPFQRRLHETLEALRKWYLIQNPKAADYAEFMEQNPILVTHLAELNAGFNLDGSFVRETRIKQYVPSRIPSDDPVLISLAPVVLALHMPRRDSNLMATMWADYCRAKKNILEDDFSNNTLLAWCGAVICTYLDINKAYQFSTKEFLEFTGVTQEAFDARIKDLRETLELEDFDPRYIDEEGLIILALQ